MDKCKVSIVYKRFRLRYYSSNLFFPGKYQLQVFPEAGHFIQEDQPAKTAQILADFYKRNDRSALVLPPKVADMQAAAAMKKGSGAGGSGSG